MVSETGNGSWNDFIFFMKHNFDRPSTFGTNYDYPCGPSFLVGFQEDGQPTVIGEMLNCFGPSLLGCISLVFCGFVSC
jgi:hypothetical protein